MRVIFIAPNWPILCWVFEIKKCVNLFNIFADVLVLKILSLGGWVLRKIKQSKIGLVRFGPELGSSFSSIRTRQKIIILSSTVLQHKFDLRSLFLTLRHPCWSEEKNAKLIVKKWNNYIGYFLAHILVFRIILAGDLNYLTRPVNPEHTFEGCSSLINFASHREEAHYYRILVAIRIYFRNRLKLVIWN